MNNIKLINAIPTLFGVIAVAGIALVYLTKGATPQPLAGVIPVAVVGGVLLTFITSIFSAISAFRTLKQVRSHKVFWVNIAWLSFSAILITIVLYSLANWSITTF